MPQGKGTYGSKVGRPARIRTNNRIKKKEAGLGKAMNIIKGERAKAEKEKGIMEGFKGSAKDRGPRSKKMMPQGPPKKMKPMKQSRSYANNTYKEGV
jgi:hypothetical protein|tara:strand:+ start:196 stop:486 length:291 start_codon:yes stop_codon:yes gene_type:complete